MSPFNGKIFHPNTTTKKIYGILLILVGIGMMRDSVLAGIFTMLSSFLFFDYSTQLYERIIKRQLTRTLKIIMVFVYLAIGVSFLPQKEKTEQTTQNNNNNSNLSKYDANGNQISNATKATDNILAITALELDLTYKANEVSADRAFKGKTIRITGIVESITKDFMDNIVVTLKGENQFLGIRCYFEDENTAASLSKGQRIVIKGICEGMTVGCVLVKECTFE